MFKGHLSERRLLEGVIDERIYGGLTENIIKLFFKASK